MIYALQTPAEYIPLSVSIYKQEGIIVSIRGFLLLLIGFWLLLLTDCQSADQSTRSKPQLEVWFHSGKPSERRVFNEQVARFNQTHADLTIKALLLPEGSYNDQVNGAALAGDLPPLLEFDGPYLYNYAWSGYLIPLDSFVTGQMKADFLPSLLDQGTYGSKLFSLGGYDSGLAIWANRSYLQKAGVRIPKSINDHWDKAEFMQAVKQLQALKEVEYAIDFKMNYRQREWYTYAFLPILKSFGGDLIDRSDYSTAEGILNGPEAVAALRFIQQLFAQGYANPEPAGDDDFYINQICALSWVGHWMWGAHHQHLGDDLVLIPMPDFGKGPKTTLGSWNWGITTNCRQPDQAWQFLEFLLSPREILHMTAANGAVPARESAIDSSRLYGAEGPLRVLAEQLKSGWGVPRPVTPAYPAISAAFAEALQNIIVGADVKKELDQAVEKIEWDLQYNNGYPISE